MKKIAFIVQRYGLEVNGGAEYHCRILAERLTVLYEVDILTTCSLEYQKWSNHYPPGADVVNGLSVLRFPTQHNRMGKEFSSANRKLTRHSRPGKRSWRIRLEAWWWFLTGNSITRYRDRWAEYQGPYVPGLISHLTQHHDQYDALIFFTYLYYPTIEGLKIAPHKSILIPTAHDEPPIYLPVFTNLFSLPKAILYNSLSEKRFVNRMFHNESLYADIVGVGIEPAMTTHADAAANRPTIDSPYLIYIGRIDTAKGCDGLFDYFIRYKEKAPSALKLVLVGQAFMPIPEHPDFVTVGFVDEGVKVALLERAVALVIPSLYESLSMVTLESFSYGIPVIANGHCEVLDDHIKVSNGGISYKNYPDFEQAVHQILEQDRSKMARNARTYVEQNYTWDKVLTKFAKAVDYVTSR